MDRSAWSVVYSSITLFLVFLIAGFQFDPPYTGPLRFITSAALCAAAGAMIVKFWVLPDHGEDGPSWWWTNLDYKVRVFIASLPFALGALCALAALSQLLVAVMWGGYYPTAKPLLNYVVFPPIVFFAAYHLAKPFVLARAGAAPQPPTPPPPPPPTPIKDRLRAHIESVVLKEDLILPPRHILDYIYIVAEVMYAAEPFNPPSQLVLPPEPHDDPIRRRLLEQQWAGIHETAFTALAESFTRYVRLLPHFEPGPFQRPLYEVVDLAQLSYALITPLRGLPFDIFHNIPYQFDMACRDAHGKLPPRMQRKDGKVTRPQDFKGPPAEAYKLFGSQSIFANLYSLEVPFKIGDTHRTSHAWCMARPKAGKTTLISAQLLDDLERMGNNECSIFIMDSQDNDHFIKSLVRFKQFAPGEKWHDRLIYIEPDLQYTPAINPFDVGDLSTMSENDKFAVTEVANTTIKSMLISILNRPLTEKQADAFEPLITATCYIPKANTDTFLELLQPGGYLKYQRYISKAPRGVQQWLHSEMRVRDKKERQSEYADSVHEIAGRIKGLATNALFERMLGSSEAKIDLYDLLSKPNVVIVNTKRHFLQDKVEAFGRIFLNALVIAIRKRGAEPHPLKSFFYIDEAADYLKTDERLAEAILQGRKQNVAIMVAHQISANMSKPVLEALRAAKIHYTPAGAHAWDALLKDEARGGGDVTLRFTPPPVDFIDPKYEKMSPDEWRVVLREQRDRYCVQYGQSAPRYTHDTTEDSDDA